MRRLVIANRLVENGLDRAAAGQTIPGGVNAVEQVLARGISAEDREGGEAGAGPGQLNEPHSIALDHQGRVLVADRKNDRIQVFDAGGA
ncbi:MAG: hypothetical protein NTW28_23120, partial [Candidatus Solibacter sp.]|nr:hypothetical protein [Candidatus Solibacter sp.]